MSVTEDDYVLSAFDLYKKPSWMNQGHCVGVSSHTAEEDGSIFYPDKSNRDVAFAKSICNGTLLSLNGRECPVREVCLNYALDNGERWGVWGGNSERERRGLQRSRKTALRAAKKAALEAANKKKAAVTAVAVGKPRVKRVTTAAKKA